MLHGQYTKSCYVCVTTETSTLEKCSLYVTSLIRVHVLPIIIQHHEVKNLCNEIRVTSVICFINIFIHVTKLKSLPLNASSLYYRYYLKLRYHLVLLMYSH
jgi:hypothetical protein